MGNNGGFTRGGFTRGKVGWVGVLWTVYVCIGVEETLGPVNWWWAYLLWKESKWWRSWESGGVEGEASLLKLCYKSVVSKSAWFKSLWDLFLNRFFVWGKSKWGSFKTVRFSGTNLVLGMVLSVADFLDLEVCHKILSGLSTMVGGLGSGWDLVLTLCEARFQFPNFREVEVFRNVFLSQWFL